MTVVVETVVVLLVDEVVGTGQNAGAGAFFATSVPGSSLTIDADGNRAQSTSPFASVSRTEAPPAGDAAPTAVPRTDSFTTFPSRRRSRLTLDPPAGASLFL